MSEHSFVYTVSGVALSEAQRAKVSQAIGIAVAEALAGGTTETVQAGFLSVWRINGGRLLSVVEAEKLTVPKIVGPLQLAAPAASR